ncbi:hypothetical protein GCM10027598_60110 [Amycolatopsis oliviviridis]
MRVIKARQIAVSATLAAAITTPVNRAPMRVAIKWMIDARVKAAKTTNMTLVL